MQIDIHFYGTYCLARAAGLTSEIAHTIATASQFVNDATIVNTVIIENKQCVRPIRTSFKGIKPPYSDEDAWRVWIPFHFLPGNEPEDGSFHERILCRKNSLIAQKLALFALKPDHCETWPYIMGITAHAYADTFSHYGFAGIPHKSNCVSPESIRLNNNHQQIITEYLEDRSRNFQEKYNIPGNQQPLGHVQAATYPDRPFLKWRFETPGKKSTKTQWRDNTADSMEACECLYYFFQEFAKKNKQMQDPKGHKAWKDISSIIRFILGIETPCDQRIPVWKRNLLSGMFGEVTPVDQDLHYDSHRWQLNRVRWESEDAGGNIEKSHAYLFHRAARVFQRYVLEELLVEHGLLK